MLQRLFHLDDRNTSVRIEVTAGLTTFMTMAYIIVVNPSILDQIPGLRHASVSLAAATCIAAAVPTIIMGLFTNTPFALAPGMGLNGVLTYTICLQDHVPWQTAMGIVFIEGVIIMLLVVTRTREAVMNAIPLDLKRAISVGIGLFIAYLGLRQSGLTGIDYSSATLTGRLPHHLGVVFGGLALILTVILFVRKVRGSLLIGIAIMTVLGLAAHLTHLPSTTTAFVIPQLSTTFHANVLAALQPGMWATILAFVMSDFFDAMGTVVGVGQQAGLVDSSGNMPTLRNVLLVDGFAAMWGGICGTSSATTYIESASGVAEGGRTGLSSLVVGVMFLLAILATPLVTIIPYQATAPALLVVGFLMLATITKIDWGNVETSIPAFITIVTIPFSHSIAQGIGLGFIVFVAVMAASGKLHKVSPILLIVAALFLVSFIY